MKLIQSIALVSLVALSSAIALAAPPVATEKLNVEQLNQQYWSQKDKTELSVVQQRTYTKALKVEFNLFAGSLSADPFFTDHVLGGKLAFHLSEVFYIAAMYMKDYQSPSSALTFLNDTLSTTVNSNTPKAFMGGELGIAPVYGKLSLFGKAIIHYDLHFALGAGLRQTESGNYMAPLFGLGQFFYLSRMLALSVEYRGMMFKEHLLERVNPDTMGQVSSDRTNFSHSVLVGFSFLVGGSSNTPKE